MKSRNGNVQLCSMNMEQRNAIDLSTLKYRRTGLGCYLMGQKDTLGALGTGASSFDSVRAKQILTPLHNLPLILYKDIKGDADVQKATKILFHLWCTRTYIHKSIASITTTIIQRWTTGIVYCHEVLEYVGHLPLAQPLFLQISKSRITKMLDLARY